MLVKLLKSKLHRARVTETKLHYAGSLAVDSELMDKVGLLPYEAITIADLNNGARLETYVVPAEPGSKKIVVMGAAAQLIKPKDIVIIFSFGMYTSDEAKEAKPKVIVLDENNDVEKTL
jgi:aspartate 1-decarboxylase